MISVPAGVPGVNRGGLHGCALRHELAGPAIQQALQRDPHASDLFVCLGKSGKLINIFWYDRLGASLYAKLLEKGRLV